MDSKLHWPRAASPAAHSGQTSALGGDQQGFREEGRRENDRSRGRGAERGILRGGGGQQEDPGGSRPRAMAGSLLCCHSDSTDVSAHDTCFHT